jgi:hypothetical protein
LRGASVIATISPSHVHDVCAIVNSRCASDPQAIRLLERPTEVSVVVAETGAPVA